MPEMTATQRLANHILAGNLQNYVMSRRTKGDSWRRISMDLFADTGIDVTHETVRAWYGALDKAAA